MPLKALEKKIIFFCLEDTLIPGKVEKEVNLAEVYQILDNLKKLEQAYKQFHLILLTGLPEETALKKIKEFNLDNYFKKENTFFVTQDYIKSKTAMDLKHYRKKIQENPEFKDEYFKQTVIEKFKEKFKPEEMLLIGHDVWSEGFYTMRFSKIDFALIKSSFSHLDKRMSHLIKGLTYIKRDWHDIKALLLGKKEKADLKPLEKYVFESMRLKLFDTKTMKIVGKPIKGLEVFSEKND